jgi:prepilin-type N-terminal cleavage/methylation domain-containing protein
MRRGEEGFTLIELVVSTMIMGLLVVSIGGAMSTVYVNSASTTIRMTQTHDAQSVTSYFQQDAGSVGVRDWANDARPLKQSIERNVAYNAGLYPCGAAGTGDAVVRMAWDDFDPSDTTRVKLDVVAYVPRAAGSAGVLEMHRVVCQKIIRISDASVLSSSTHDQLVVHSLGTGASASCAPSSCTATTPPATVTLNLTIHDQRQGQPDLALALAGHPRQS